MSIAIGMLLATGALLRLMSLDRIHPVLDGDEANHIDNGLAIVSGAERADPFDGGVLSIPNLSTLPAGAGALWGSDPMGGPRTPYALFGTLALVFSAGLGGAAAGPVGAVGTLALLIACPNHVHFSRSAFCVILDSCTVVATLLCLIGLWRSGSPRIACLAGIAAGLALYGYAGGRVAPILLGAGGVGALLPRRFRGRRGLIAAAMLTGFVVAAAPTLRCAAKNFGLWNGRPASVFIFRKDLFYPQVERLGSPAAVIANQIRLGTLGLLSSAPTTHFTGHPMIGPAVLPALGIAGLGWLIGRRRWFEAFLLGMGVMGNLAGVVLTAATPEPQRPSSLVPILAILGGIAVAGAVGLLPARAAHASRRGEPPVLTAIVAVLLLCVLPPYPLELGGAIDSGGWGAAFAQEAALFSKTPFAQRHRLYLHDFSAGFPNFDYFSPHSEFSEISGESPLLPGLHFVPVPNEAAERRLREAAGSARVIRLGDPAHPREAVGEVFAIPQRPDGSPGRGTK